MGVGVGVGVGSPLTPGPYPNPLTPNQVLRGREGGGELHAAVSGVRLRNALTLRGGRRESAGYHPRPQVSPPSECAHASGRRKGGNLRTGGNQRTGANLRKRVADAMCPARKG